VKVIFCDSEPWLVSRNKPSLMKISVTVFSAYNHKQLASKIVAFCCVFQLSEQNFVRTEVLYPAEFCILQAACMTLQLQVQFGHSRPCSTAGMLQV